MLTRTVFSILVLLIVQIDGYSQFQSKITFTSIRRGNQDIYVMIGSIDRQKQLTINPADDYHPTWSPNGEQIAFVSNRIKGKVQVWIIDKNGNNPVRLTNGVRDEYPDWSPDGKRIVYQSESRKQFGQPVFEIHVIDTDKSNQRKLVGENSIHPSWSPGGTRVVFSYSKDFETNQVYSIGLDSHKPKQLTADEVYKRYPKYSPDGETIAYVGRQHIWLMKSNGQGRKQLTHEHLFSEEHITWSPDGKFIAFHSPRRLNQIGIHSVNLFSEEVIRVLANNGEANFQPDWYKPDSQPVDLGDKIIATWGEIKELQ